MARAGAFGGGLSPFGGSSPFSGSGQFDIGADLADLAVYETEIKWGNGLATDAEYIAALTKSVASTDPGTHRRDAAQNKLDDAVYRIGRSVADTKGLDQLVAFDTAAIAKMRPDNLRYRDVKGSLDSELAQRRSRDYGRLTTAYNAGKTSTQSLLDFVNAQLKTLAPDAPDLANWTNTKGELTDRLTSETDSKVYQDFQRQRIKAPEFLAYIQKRRDSFGTASPQYADWSRKLEDAQNQIKDAAQSLKDSTFFNRYQEGKVSDATYLNYLRTRITGMPKDDPQLGEWKHRLTQATFSLAEDKLRFDVGRGTTPASHLVHFYEAYRRTLNPNSAEWRTITRSLDVLHRAGASGGGGGGGRGGARKPKQPKYGTAANAMGAGPLPTYDASGKVINPKYTLGNIMGLFAVNPNGKKKDVAVANKYLSLNKSSLTNALGNADTVWLFHDPRYPNATVPELDPQGNPTGNMVRGSAYLPVTSEALANIHLTESHNFMAASEVALAHGDTGGSATALRRAGEAMDSARQVDATSRGHNWDDWYKGASAAIDRATMSGDYAGALVLSNALASKLTSEASNPYLDDTRRAKLVDLQAKIADNPIMPTYDPTTGAMIAEGAVNVATFHGTGTVALNPGWHHVLKADDRGRPAWGPVFDDKQDGSWEASHVTVNTTLGNQVVTGEASVSSAATDPNVHIHTPTGDYTIPLGGGAKELTYLDEHGVPVRAYSIDDGATWISAAPGEAAPTVEIDADLTAVKDANGNDSLVDTATQKPVFTQSANGWQQDGDYFAANPGVTGWYGQKEVEAAKGVQAPATFRDFQSGTKAEQGPTGPYKGLDTGWMDVGGKDQHMTLVTTSPSGAVNLIPSGWRPYVAPLLRSAISTGRDYGSLSGPEKAPAYRPIADFSTLSKPEGFGPRATLPPDTPARVDAPPKLPPLPPVRFTSSTVLPAMTPPELRRVSQGLDFGTLAKPQAPPPIKAAAPLKALPKPKLPKPPPKSAVPASARDYGSLSRPEVAPPPPMTYGHGR